MERLQLVLSILGLSFHLFLSDRDRYAHIPLCKYKLGRNVENAGHPSPKKKKKNKVNKKEKRKKEKKKILALD
jgi:hypothetical protein